MMALDVATLLLGCTWACAAFTCTKAFKQTYMCWHRSGRVNAYIVMVWLEWTSCIAVSLMSWMFLERSIHPSFGYFFMILILWVIELQCITQIIINRVSLIMFNPTRVFRLKWMIAVFIGLINISVFCVWIPAHLHASPTIMRANQIWDRTEKVIFLVLELGLNGYFMWLIRSELISNGLTKYDVLFKFNVAMVVLSVSLDVVIIGVMSLPDDLVYVQFQALFFLIKLHIEMTMAELIATIARTTAASTDLSDVQSRTRHRSCRSGPSEARFSCSVTWQQCFGLDSSKRPIGEALDQGDNDSRDLADLERLAGTRSPIASRNESRTRERLDSTATTEVDSMVEIEKQWTSETCESCSRVRPQPCRLKRRDTI